MFFDQISWRCSSATHWHRYAWIDIPETRAVRRVEGVGTPIDAVQDHELTPKAEIARIDPRSDTLREYQKETSGHPIWVAAFCCALVPLDLQVLFVLSPCKQILHKPP
jgi:hypothetical protein